MSVNKNDQGSWDFVCDEPRGCGIPGGTPFPSTGWPTKKIAEARGAQHKREHQEGVPMPELAEFRREHGIDVDIDGNAFVKGE